LSFLFIYQKIQHPHWLCCRVCPFPLFQKWFHLALDIFFFGLFKSWRNRKRLTRQGFGTCAIVRDAIPPYTEWESEAITCSRKQTHYFSIRVVCLSVGFFLFYFILLYFFIVENTAGAFS
jgi:hypothetical protein